MDSERTINLLEIEKKDVTWLFMGQSFFFFGNSVITFRHYYYVK